MMINKCKLRLTAYTSLQGVLGGLINGGAYIRGGLLLLFQDCKSSQTKTQNYLDKSRIKISTSLESNSVLESEFNNNVT